MGMSFMESSRNPGVAQLSLALGTTGTSAERLSPIRYSEPWSEFAKAVALHWIRGLVALNLKLLSTIPVQSLCTGIVDFCIGNRDKAYAKLRPQFRYSNAPPSGPVIERVSGLLLMPVSPVPGFWGSQHFSEIYHNFI